MGLMSGAGDIPIIPLSPGASNPAQPYQASAYVLLPYNPPEFSYCLARTSSNRLTRPVVDNLVLLVILVEFS